MFRQERKTRFLPERRASYTDISLGVDTARFATAFCDLLGAGHTVALGELGGRLLWTKDVAFPINKVCIDRSAKFLAVAGETGDLALIEDGKVNVRLRVAAPGWVRPRKAVVFLNGASVAEQEVPNEPGKPTDATLSFVLPIRGVDAHLVCIVLGDPVKHRGWKTLNDYTLAATNPVFLDVNGDGKYNSPRESAQRIYGSLGGDVDALMNTLEIVPAPVGVQILALAHDRFQGLDLARLNEAIKRLAELNPAFVLYQSNRAAAAKSAASPAK